MGLGDVDTSDTLSRPPLQRWMSALVLFVVQVCPCMCAFAATCQVKIESVSEHSLISSVLRYKISEGRRSWTLSTILVYLPYHTAQRFPDRKDS